MSPDLTTPPTNTHADTAADLLKEAAGELPENAATAAIKTTMAQAHATLALVQETRATAYDTRTTAYVAYLATLTTENHAGAQHAAVVDKLIRDRLNFTPHEGATTQ